MRTRKCQFSSKGYGCCAFGRYQAMAVFGWPAAGLTLRTSSDLCNTCSDDPVHQRSPVQRVQEAEWGCVGESCADSWGRALQTGEPVVHSVF